MRLKLKEDPKEWRKVTLLTALGLALISTVLRWRRILPAGGWLSLLGVLALVASAALICPHWFRGFYRVSSRVGFVLAQWVGCALLALLFFVIVTPLGLVLRLFGKDLLRLKRSTDAETYWKDAKESNRLDRLF